MPTGWSGLVMAVVVSLAGATATTGAQSRSSRTLHLDPVDVVGAVRYTRADVVRTSGLVAGRRTSMAQLDQAVRRMAATGLFAKVTYKTTTIGERLRVIFVIEESRWTMPVTFDNFVWFSDEEIVATLRETIPTFDGTAPEAPGMPELLTRSLQALLTAKNITGRVEFRPQATPGGGINSYEFRVVDPRPRMCGFRFPGARIIPASSLESALRNAGGADYSRSYLTRASDGILGDMYRQRGHWAVSIAPAEPRWETGCDGVVVTAAVDEGAVHAWGGTEWRGNQVKSATELNAALGLSAGQIAELNQLRDGIRRVESVYERQGHVRRRIAYAPRLDRSESKVFLVFTVEEGPQYRMGTLVFEGVSPDLAAILRGRWRLAAGDVYDGLYAR